MIEAAASPASCELHKRHAPENRTLEVHHVVPVAWQLFWQPPQPWPFPGNDTEGRGKLWDDRTIVVCPTGHRNVHFYIVQFMHAVVDESAQRAFETVKATPSLTTGWATQALRRFKEVGGELPALAAHEWGES